ncbi:acyl-CoA reductase [Phaeobacter sp. B1627]|uniref:acyl-CoA reductase n=1 Tax=Phaeobacter sp. B1627 TaxID=2583809 RepID=UPI00159EC0FA|nr:acyl-CoA reductase [Phaeobacter sp. B1627]
MLTATPEQADVQILVGPARLESIKAVPPRPSVDPEVLALLSRWARQLLSEPEVMTYPDVMAFASWCRTVPGLAAAPEGTCRMGRGLVFHIAPSNVPTMFAFSLVAGLLAGNANVVRLPSGGDRRVDLLCETLSQVLSEPEFEAFRDAICLLRYAREVSDVTSRLSRLCDVRVIWGGDTTINAIRTHAIPAHASDLVFADRSSAALIHADAWLSADSKDQTLRGFYNDTYLYDQNACSAPRAVIWCGEAVEEAQADFWSRLENLLAEQFVLKPIAAVNKLEFAMQIAATVPNTRMHSTSNLAVRTWVPEISEHVFQGNPGHGCFVETQVTEIDQLFASLPRRIQTLSYFGLDPQQIRQCLIKARARGVDRVVPIGKTLDFSLIWDGHDIIGTLSRTIRID